MLSDHLYGLRRTGDLQSCVTSVWSFALRDLTESFVVALDISKAFGRVFLNFLPSTFHLLSVLFYLIISQTDPYLLW